MKIFSESNNSNSSNHLSATTSETTSHIIYESFKRKQLGESKNSKHKILIISLIVALNIMIIITLLQYNQYVQHKYSASHHDEKSVCFLPDSELISTILSFVILIIYISMYKRRVFKRDEYKFRNIGLPMIVSCWNKSDRTNTSMVYGLIATNVFSIVKSTLHHEVDSYQLSSIDTHKDPSGILTLLIKVVEVFIVGTRYYPILCAFRTHSLFLNFSSCIFAWVDLIENIYEYGICDWSYDDANAEVPFFVLYKFCTTIPIAIFSSYICITLTFRIFTCLFDYMFKTKNFTTKSKLISQSKDSCFAPILDVNDEHEILYSTCNINYVFNLLNPISKKITNFSPEVEVVVGKMSKLDSFKKNFYPKLIEFVHHHIYKWDDNFRFTSRFLNTMVVAATCLYYFFLFWFYWILKKISVMSTDDFDEIQIKTLICDISEQLCLNSTLYDTAFETVDKFLTISLMSDVNKKEILIDSVQLCAILPVFVSFIICFIQLLLIARDCKKHLHELYKGDCEFVKKAKNLQNGKIAGNSFHFGGFLIGYLIWGYLIIYIVSFIICAFFMYCSLYSSETYALIAKKLLPFIAVLIIKNLVNKFTAKYIFLNRKSKILALENFRAFNVFLYFNFFFDCFMGLISAIIRLTKAVISAIIMMPRISYSFLGRHLEKYDNGYACYSGFLHMEAMHTNPIINTFCSLLYYPGLSDHIKKFSNGLKIDNVQENRLVEVPEFLGIIEKKKKFQLNSKSNETFIISTREYSKKNLNRWHLYLYLNKNRTLLFYRKHQCQILIHEASQTGSTTESRPNSEMNNNLIQNLKFDESRL